MTRYSFDETDAPAIVNAVLNAWNTTGGQFKAADAALIASCVADAPPALSSAALLAHLGTAPASIGDRALSLAVPFVEAREGCKLTSYHGSADRPGVWTVGTGFITWGGKPVGPGLTITQAENDANLRAILSTIAARFCSVEPIASTPGQLAALYSLAFNAGTTAILASTLVKDWRAGNVSGAATQFAAWDHANGKVVPGLITRRALERALFLSV